MAKIQKSDVSYQVWVRSLYMTLPDSDLIEMEYSAWYARNEDILYTLYNENSLIKQKKLENESQKQS